MEQIDSVVKTHHNFLNDNPILDTPSGCFETTFLNRSLRNNDKGRQKERQLVSMEPDFREDAGACHVVYWHDCIAQLAVDIQEKQNAASPCDFEFLKPQIVEYVFTVCVRLRLPSEIRFTAVLILNIYMLRQLCALYDFVEKKSMPNRQKQREWENLEANVERQLPLRILSAIQISSKIHSYHDSISSRQVVNTLRKIGYPYTLSAVVNSEQRVFKFIGFQIPGSPLEACEMTMKVLTFTLSKRKMMDESMYDSLWQHVLMVLDICFINHAQIYDNFLEKRPCSLTSIYEKRIVLARLKWDALLLAAATVQTAAILCLGDNNSLAITEVTNRLLKCDPEFVELLIKSIIEIAMLKKDGIALHG